MEKKGMWKRDLTSINLAKCDILPKSTREGKYLSMILYGIL
jgi:hypothetical protein